MQNVMIVSGDGVLLASAGPHSAADLPTPAMLVQAALPAGYASAEGGLELHDDGTESGGGGFRGGVPAPLEPAASLRLRVLVAVPGPSVSPRYLQLLQAVPPKLATNGEVLRAAYSEYKERFVARVGLRKMYMEILTLTLLLAIFGAIGSAFLIAGNLA